ncbi:MAG: asparagine synthase, partial [Archaeoglobi archaeon]|nr:asparagine synthase [Archaeoglobi archaeon]
ISFSGGVDSSFLTHFYDVPLISVTASKAEEERIRETARLLGREVEILRFDEEVVRKVLVDVVRAIENTNPLQVSIAVPIYLAMSHAKRMGFDEIIFGQGADELFGGYKRYENMIGKNLEKAIEEDVRNLGVNNLVRDHKLSYVNEIRLIAPYLHFDVIETALSISPSLKVYRGEGGVVRKYFLREVASRYIPREVAYREKKAIQYSTNTYKILERIAKSSGESLQDFLKGLRWR